MNEKMQSKGLTTISMERIRQVVEEGFGAEHDAQWQEGELVRAAVAYLTHYLFAHLVKTNPTLVETWRFLDWLQGWWPWSEKWWKPKKDEPVRDLARAGALIAAEIDRINLAGSEKSE